ncbi:MAG: hypothetical protein JSU68_02090 [Phycisphaerales bacterium]|nr:MAG: hypothetical protein JSU68_02090 [Phycisphaerales bacterium]
MRSACSLSPLIATWLPAAFLVTNLFVSACNRQPTPTEDEPAAIAEEAGTGTETHLASTTATAPEMLASGLVARDDDDDPRAPACLPHSDTVPGWVKTQAIRIESGERYLQNLPDSYAASHMRPYGIMDVATCTYEKQAGNRPSRLAVELLRCRSSADAYGLCSTQRLGRDLGHAHRVWADRQDDYYLLHAWRSDYYLRATATPADGETPLSQARQFMGRILLALPKADPPLLVRTLPSEVRQADRIWFAPTCLPLAASGARLLTAEQAVALDDILRMPRARGLAAAAYQSDPAEPPNIVWLIEYPTPGDARSAYARYKNALDRQAGAAMSTPSVPAAVLLSPIDRFLAGSWSPEEESAMHVLPLVRATLSKLAERPE